ncbi:flagellar protein FliT [Oceanobacillus limi]|uniref:Flagellar protein FliT n=1 Tax=Oceanobacillus limi TaxID=930131 RepID=A0A1I0BRM1_9BACI|nr:flagellar protein FliT [Oceanobacillus limi]SET09729.1 flagellar protein FliT [Oceanobacillus limi]
MNRMKDIYDITLQLNEIVNQDITAKNRQAVIEQINQLIDKRGNAMHEAKPPFSAEEKLIGEKLIPLNKDIEAKMRVIFDDLKQEMKQSKKQKKSNKTYINPYDKVQTADGMFMDRKK